MTEFDDGEYGELLRKKKACNAFNTACVAALIILAVLCAVLSANAEKSDGAFTTFIVSVSLFGAVAITFSAGNIFFVRKVSTRLKRETAKAIASEMTADPSLLSGGTEVKLRVTYADETLTVARVNAVREITVGKHGGLLSGVKRAEFNLKRIRPLQRLFTDFGVRIFEFIGAYYAVNCDFNAVTVIDETGKTAEEIPFIRDGKPVYKTKNNYFLKNGIIND